MLKLGKGWRKWLMIGFLVVLGVLAVMAFATGCSGKSSSTNTVTPIQALQTDVDAVEANIDTIETSLWDHGNSITAYGTRITNLETSKTAIEERLANLETGSTPQANLSGIEAEIAMLDLRLTSIEDRVANISLPAPTATASPAATPTPTPVLMCGVQKPTVIAPSYGNMSVPNGSVHFEWSACANAAYYEFWIGTDSSSMTNVKNVSAPARFTDYPSTSANTYYYWKVVAVSPCNDRQSDAWWFKTAP